MNDKIFTLEDAREIMDTILKYISDEKPGKPVAIAIMDTDKTLKCLYRMDKATSNNVNMAFNKAWTSIHMGANTRMIKQKLVEEFGYQLSYFNCPEHLTPIPGGVLIKSPDDEVIGAIGISGRIADEDEELALYGIAAFSKK